MDSVRPEPPDRDEEESDEPESRRRLERVFREAFRRAIEKGVDFKTIAAWVGHKDGGVLVAQTYGHLRDTHSKEMAKLMTE